MAVRAPDVPVHPRAGGEHAPLALGERRGARGYGAVVYYRGDAQFEVNDGWSRPNGVGQTKVGGNQVRSCPSRNSPVIATPACKEACD